MNITPGASGSWNNWKYLIKVVLSLLIASKGNNLVTAVEISKYLGIEGIKV